ncbi:MAG: threonine--tRNA ligase [Polyangiaceae bacterium]|nr:threonine--tRNA ligase [Polyangiaceae bacterium]
MEPDDHRAIAKKLDLFHFQEEAPGMVFWHPRGFSMFRELEEANRRYVRAQGYVEVRSPQLIRQPVWERSGHWQHFKENMFVLEEDEGRAAALKPVSCPGHLEIASRMSLSYRDLPLRFAELGVCHRNEQSGALSGLFRLRQFVQDDGHVLCDPDDVVDEVARFCASLSPFYRAFGFESIQVSLAGRPESRFGEEAIWDKAEAALADAAREAGLDFDFVPGGGAFYGPKLEIALVDSSKRQWQCGTVQVDYFLPGRFGVQYAARDGSRRAPAMLHRALYGSLERFLGIVIEHHRGRMPAWLSPEQVRVVPLRSSEHEHAISLARELRDRGMRVGIDDGSEGISKRVALAHASEVPFVAVLGPREIAAASADLRSREGRDVLPRGELVARLAAAVAPPW